MIIEGLGIILTGYGFLATWREFNPGEGLFNDSKPALLMRRAYGTGRRRIVNLIRRLRGQPPETEAHAGTAHATAGGTINARGTMVYEPLPEGVTVEEAIALLDSRTRTLSLKIIEEEGRRLENDNRLRTMIGEVSATAKAEAAAAQEKTVRLAVGGLRIAMLGLILVFVGLLGQAAGTIVGDPDARTQNGQTYLIHEQSPEATLA